VPLLYDFYRNEFPDLLRNLEKKIEFKNMRSKDIIDYAMNENDPLCMKVVTKFTEVLGVECGNFALLTLPYAGIYLLGGVVNGIEQYLKSD